ncbi:hypothetical protein LCGC14_2097340 [marine sediment metagenome]|jgi:hypothetical protein|uniref:PepSY domain-containing protein n=1 Tax=marine sediment metagenome TaxID=412755 RepID=A0A0F9GP63_9ZZZZ|nr:PepSY domain-containing protein [Sulfitobacter sp. BSw21498]OUU25375.1 MAG: hypothetical protein CBB97_09805 [Candidatus Endolissoclinum sp. TMED37]|tara:strand:- start:966 stop:1250 length:285 start_codon:yes stop_codon:yes gene_type:complete
MSKLLLSTAAVLMLAAPAFAEDMKCNVPDQTTWMSQEDLTTMYVEQGYEVKNIKIDEGCYEIYGIDANGERVEIYVDPVTGIPVDAMSEESSDS